jgi:hypothetical protein
MSLSRSLLNDFFKNLIYKHYLYSYFSHCMCIKYDLTLYKIHLFLYHFIVDVQLDYFQNS